MSPLSLPRSVRALGAAMSALVVLFLSLRARATEHAVLAFSRSSEAAECPTEEEVRRAVVARLGYDPFEGVPADTALFRVYFARNSSGFSARIERISGKRANADSSHESRMGSRARPNEGAARELMSATCGDLLAPTAIALSIAIDPLALPERSPSGAMELPVLPPPAVAAAASAGSAPHSRATERASNASTETAADIDTAGEAASLRARAANEPRVLLYVSPHLAFGSTPSPALGASAGLGGRFGAFSLALEGRADLPSSTTVGNGEVRAHLLAGALVPCVHRSIVSACGVVIVGSVIGEGRGVTEPSSDASRYFAVGGRAGFEIPIREHLYFSAHGELVAALSSTVLRLDGVDAWKSPGINGAFGLALGTTF